MARYPEWINATDGGLLHRPNDRADLSEKLALLLRDADLRKRLGQQGRCGIFEKFSSECMAASTLDVMRQLSNTQTEKNKISS